MNRVVHELHSPELMKISVGANLSFARKRIFRRAVKVIRHSIIVMLLILTLSIHVNALDEYPNVLLIIADDLGMDPMPNYMMDEGLIKAHMPNIEALMARGITFDNVWSNPTCSPTRATILTGRYGFRTNVLDVQESGVISTDEYTLHQNLTEGSHNDIASTIIGKWHLSGGGRRGAVNIPSQMGIKDYAGLYGGTAQDYYNWDMVVDETRLQSSEYITSTFTDLALDWINSQDSAWFAWVAYTAPHTPFHLPPEGTHTQKNLSGTEDDISNNPFPYYIAMIENLDYEIGRLLAGIPADELENTTIIFVGDNGTAAQVIQLFSRQQAKGSIYEGGIHVPMVIAGTGVNLEGVRTDRLINLADLFPTISDLFGIASPAEIDGQSFLPLLSDTDAQGRDWIYSESLERRGRGQQAEIVGRVVTIRNETYKLIDAESGADELYNVVSDPYETSNLFDGNLTPDIQDEVDDLYSILIQIGAR